MNNEKLQAAKQRIDTNTEQLDIFVTNLVDDRFRALDDYMQQVDNYLKDNGDIPTSLLESMIVNLNSMLYWVGSGISSLTLKESMAKMIREEVYNTAYGVADGTIGDKKSAASLAAQEDDLIKVCYSNAVKLYQYKVDRAVDMANALKKLLNYRTEEIQLSRGDIR